MYARNAGSPEPIGIGAVIQISDGAVQTSGVTVRIKPIGVAEADGVGTTAYSTSGIVLYTPTQAETNYTSFILIATKALCIPVSITVVTTASATSGTVLLAPITHTSAVIPTVSVLTGHTAQTGDTFLLANGATGFAAIDTVVDAILADTSVALPEIAPGSIGGLLTAPTTANTGLADVTRWLGAAVATPTVAGVPEVDVTHANGELSSGVGTVNANLTQIAGVVQSATDLKHFADSGYDPATSKVQGVVLVDDLTNLPAIPTDWITAAGINASALNNKGNWNVGKSGYTLSPTTGLGNQNASLVGNITGNVTGSVGSVGTDGISAAAIAAAAANKIADHVRRRTQENVEASSDGDALSLGSLYGLIQQGQESNATATPGSLTVYRTDGTTVLGTKTLTTNATADPVDGIS